ncbi:MAG: hypothetical protein ACPGPG_09335, partial [Luminiphilus sp.]
LPMVAGGGERYGIKVSMARLQTASCAGGCITLASLQKTVLAAGVDSFLRERLLSVAGTMHYRR